MTAIDDRDPIKIVSGFMVEGQGNAEIVEYLLAENMSPEEAAAVFEQALGAMVKAAKLPRSVRLGWCLEALRDIYRKLVVSEDYAGALQAVKEIAKLTDLYKKGGEADLKTEIDEYIDAVMTLS